MIVSVGTDLVCVKRIERLVNRFGPRFLEKCFTPDENERVLSHRTKAKQIAGFAKLYAAKEAILKATGRGMRTGMCWHDMVIGRDVWGKPDVTVSGQVAEHLDAVIPVGMKRKIDISLSDDGDYALAFVVISAYKE